LSSFSICDPESSGRYPYVYAFKGKKWGIVNAVLAFSERLVVTVKLITPTTKLEILAWLLLSISLDKVLSNTYKLTSKKQQKHSTFLSNRDENYLHISQ
jgi:hypothetical protein